MTTPDRAAGPADAMSCPIELACADPAHAVTELLSNRAGREVLRIHYGNPDARAEAWNEGWDEAHRQGVGGHESREWLLRVLARHGVSPTTADDIADEVLADTSLEPADDPGPQCRVTRAADGAQCRHHGPDEHEHVDQRGQAIDLGHLSSPDQLIAQAFGLCWHSPTSDRWPCGPAAGRGDR